MNLLFGLNIGVSIACAIANGLDGDHAWRGWSCAAFAWLIATCYFRILQRPKL